MAVLKHRRYILGAVAVINLMVLLSAQMALAKSPGNSAGSVSTSIEGGAKWPLEAGFVFSGGYRVDDLDFNIAGDINGNNPNIISELTWDDLESYQVKFAGSLVWPGIIALRGSVDYGWIFDGDNQDSDYDDDNRTLEYSRSNNSTDDDNVWDVSLAVGYPFRFGKAIIGTITPLVGYSHHEQQLNITDGFQTIATPGRTPPVGPFDGLDSSYETEWQGPWLGLDLRFRAAEMKAFAHRLETFLTYEYHWADFEAIADWNLIEEFKHPKSFKHRADGQGYIIGAGMNCALNRRWALNASFEYREWSTDEGTIKFYLANGATRKQQLNEVNWKAYAFSAGLSMRF